MPTTPISSDANAHVHHPPHPSPRLLCYFQHRYSQCGSSVIHPITPSPPPIHLPINQPSRPRSRVRQPHSFQPSPQPSLSSSLSISDLIKLREIMQCTRTCISSPPRPSQRLAQPIAD
ncbi:unnamed protein product [Periconia digitata]|uniref:Uncharacterized protein n=1 Tax=Periconia digitata TaxID=1303443 RepID=A0A9W4UU81_9PLEO|nr:unnamed protein product [Periconia digitata]